MERRVASRLGGLAVLAMAWLLVGQSLAIAAEFSADFVEKRFGQTNTGKVCVKGLKVRREVTQGPHKSITIARMDKIVVWMLHPAQKTYMEMAGAHKEAAYMDPKKAAQQLKNLGDLKLVGKETVNGYPCDKYAFTFRDKSVGKQYQWYSPKLKTMLKVEQKSPKFSMYMEYKNIKERRVADSLFEIPKGYKKMNMRGMGGMQHMPGMKGMPRMPKR